MQVRRKATRRWTKMIKIKQWHKLVWRFNENKITTTGQKQAIRVQRSFRKKMKSCWCIVAIVAGAHSSRLSLSIGKNVNSPRDSLKLRASSEEIGEKLSLDCKTILILSPTIQSLPICSMTFLLLLNCLLTDNHLFWKLIRKFAKKK